MSGRWREVLCWLSQRRFSFFAPGLFLFSSFAFFLRSRVFLICTHIFFC